MSLPIPNNREQVYLSKVITKKLENIPIPISRFEIYLKCLLDFDKENLPTPISKQELILYDYILGNECNVLASNKTEMFLKALSTVEVSGLPTPQSKIDVFLDYIIRNGCLEKFEYYPFAIRDYLNVKNTPKAKMKLKGMKGNTLVNLENNKSRIGKWLIDEGDNSYITKPITGYCGFSIPITFSKDKKYTIIYTVISNTTNKNTLSIDAITQGKQSSVKCSLSIGTHIITITPNENCIEPSQWNDHFRFVIHSENTEVLGSISISNKIIILEGDHTQNPPNGYIEGMKSFGESKNKIEVLSVGKNLFDGTLKSKIVLGATGQELPGVEYASSDFISIPKGCQSLYYSSNYNLEFIYFYDKDKKFLSRSVINANSKMITVNDNAIYARMRFIKTSSTVEFDASLIDWIQLEAGTQSTVYQTYQSSKATLMYRNSSYELVSIPALSGKWEGDKFLWGDEILLHEDGKLYYHKRYDKCILDGSENWEYGGGSSSTIVFRVEVPEMKKHSTNLLCDKLVPNLQGEVEKIASALKDNGVMALFIRINKSKLETQDVAGLKKWLQANNVTVVYKLAKEEVYPCELSEQLYSYDGETNIFIGGDVVGETTIEIGTKLGPIVDSIRQDVDRSTRAIEGLVSYGVQECAYQLYPEDFKNVPSVIEGEINA